MSRPPTFDLSERALTLIPFVREVLMGIGHYCEIQRNERMDRLSYIDDTEIAVRVAREAESHDAIVEMCNRLRREMEEAEAEFRNGASIHRIINCFHRFYLFYEDSPVKVQSSPRTNDYFTKLSTFMVHSFEAQDEDRPN